MRALRVSFYSWLLSRQHPLPDLKVKVVDPQSSPLRRSSFLVLQGNALQANRTLPPKASTTSAEGIADFGDLSPGKLPGCKSWLRASLRRPKRFPLLTM